MFWVVNILQHRLIVVFDVVGSITEEIYNSLHNQQKRVRLKPETVDLLIFLRGNKDFVTWD
jgi:hypothetical protein